MIRRFRALALISFLVGTGAFGAMAGVAAAATICNTNPVQNTTFNDSLVVPSGANCVLINVRVNGGVTIQPGARFSAINSTITGSVTGTNVNGVNLDNTYVGGNVVVDGSTSSQAIIGICRSTVRGSVIVKNLNSPEGFIVIGPSCQSGAGNTIGGNVFVQNNVAFFEAPFPAIRVENNSIRGSLYCSGNLPGAAASNNSVSGSTIGECVGGGGGEA